MAANENAAREQKSSFFYVSEERSTRTGNHLWRERVIETDQGVLRRLVAIDGRPLTKEEAAEEDRRLGEIVSHPEVFRRLNESQRDEERHVTHLLTMLPTAFLIAPDGTIGDCVRYNYRPNPAFRPSTYEERVVHVMEGTVSIHEPDDRLCSLEARIAQPVEFGFGFLGRINSGGHFSLQRDMVVPGQWKTVRINVHVDGRIVMLKNLTRDQETVRGELRLVPPHLSLSDAAKLITP